MAKIYYQLINNNLNELDVDMVIINKYFSKYYRKKKYFCSNAKKQFTLIEMLVVIAIIGILASMLMPSLMKALEQAKSIQCLNNQRQFELAMRAYSEDYNGWRPIGALDATYDAFGKTATHVAPYWFLFNGNYLESFPVATCPILYDYSEAATASPITDTIQAMTYFSYGVFEWGAAARDSKSWNNWLSQLWDIKHIRYIGTGNSTWINYSSDKKSSQRPVIGDIANYTNNDLRSFTSYYFMSTSSLPSATRPLPTSVHGNQSVNVTMLDGHSESASMEDLQKYGIRYFRDTDGNTFLIQ